MVFSDKKAKNKSKASYLDSAVTILTPGCHFSGKLYCKGSSRIGGRIEGEIVSEGLLIIEEEAMITAEIKADEAVVQGKVKGKLEAKGRVELAQSSQFDGDIITPSLKVMEGAKFNGRSSMSQAGTEEEKAGAIPVVETIRKKGAQSKDESLRKVPEIGVNN